MLSRPVVDSQKLPGHVLLASCDGSCCGQHSASLASCAADPHAHWPAGHTYADSPPASKARLRYTNTYAYPHGLVPAHTTLMLRVADRSMVMSPVDSS
jgi:hypothetical protein